MKHETHQNQAKNLTNGLFSPSLETLATQNLKNKFSFLVKKQSYIPISGCVFEHILTTTALSNHEKLYYLLADSLALINHNKDNHRSFALPSEDWAACLNCSRSLVFSMQQSLVKKGYFVVNRDWDKVGRNKRNLIVPTLPSSVFNYLNEKYPTKVGEHAPYNPAIECKRAYLDRTKLFIKLNYTLLKIITSNRDLSPGQKIIWLGFYTRWYKNYMLQSREDFNASFISSYQELASMHSCTTKHISKSIRALEELGFIKTQNFYIRKNDSCEGSNNCQKIQERQDQSLWKITLSLPSDCALELEKLKNRSDLKQQDPTSTASLIKNCLILDGIKFNLNLEQASLLKLAIDNTNTPQSSNDYIDSVMEELETEDKLEKSDSLEDTASSDISKTLFASSTVKIFDNNEESSNGIKSDPTLAKSELLLNKNLILKIKNLKSNLGDRSKVLFNKFLKNRNEENKKKREEFNIYSQLIRNKLKTLPKDKADKARKFAYSLASKNLATGYAASLNKHELAKQLIYHAASWKPTKFGFLSREKEIDTALAVAWKAMVGGTWKMPLELAKAETLQYEFEHYKRKYQKFGIYSREIRTLEFDVDKLLGEWCNVSDKITGGAKVEDGNNKLANYENAQLDHIDYNYFYPVEKQPNKQPLFDLSRIPEQQKYLKLTPSDTDHSMQIDTINGKEYFVQVKELEMNDLGEMVMTLKIVNKNVFFELLPPITPINLLTQKWEKYSDGRIQTVEIQQN